MFFSETLKRKNAFYVDPEVVEKRGSCIYEQIKEE